MSGKKPPKAKKPSSRHCGADQVIGGPADLPLADLPLVGEVLAKAKQIKSLATQEGSGRDVSNKEVIDKLYVAIVSVYSKVNSKLVLVSEKYAKTKLETIYSDYRNLVRSGAASTSPRICAFQQKCGKLFDIIFCKCKIQHCSEVNCDGFCDQAAHIQ